jgi:hypothetical protein
MRVVLILVVLVGALFFQIARWLDPFTPVDLRTEYESYTMDAAEPADADGMGIPTRAVD